MNPVHTPVMVEESVRFLDPAPGKKYLDSTLGAGGHTLALLEHGATVTGIDRDGDILQIASDRISAAGLADRFTAVQGTFATVLTDRQILPGEDYDGVLFDLGVSSYQLDTPSRGFSFRTDAPLDMRMDQSLTVTAADLLNGLGRKELALLFASLGEVRQAKLLANAICEARKLKPFKTTQDLVRVVVPLIPKKGRIHPATQVFQALRMAVNSEREELKAALPSALSRLRAGGVMAVISFHSLEDQIVSDFLVEASTNLASVTAVPVTPQEAEITRNPRSRSAKLRVARRIA